MPLVLDDEVGGIASNSYSSAATAIEYAGYRVGGAAFIALTSDQQIQALVTAASDIDTLEDDPGFIGDRTDDVQALPFPRDGADLPANLVTATIELAMSYAPAFATGSTKNVLATSAGNGNIQEDTVGPITTKYFEAGSTSATAFERFPAVVQRLLFALVLHPSGSGWGSGSVVRGS